MIIPSGFATWLAILARNFVRDPPTDTGSCVSWRTRFLMAAPISAGGPKRWVDPDMSRKASSMDSGSTSGVNSLNTSKTRSL